jgi:hypothetical protein
MTNRFILLCAPALVALAALACGGSDSDASGSPEMSAAGASGSAVGNESSGVGAAGTSSMSTTTTGTGGSAGSVTTMAGAGGTASSGSGGASMDGSGGTGGGAGAGGSGGGSPVIPDTKVVMYLPNWSGSFSSWATKIDFNKMTHLLLAFGTMRGTSDWSLGANDNDVKTLAQAAHTANVKVLVSIGGADDDIGIIDAYATASNIDPMVNNLDAFITRLNLDGVDVDLERGNMMRSTGNFPQFMSKLVAKLRPEGKLVTAALAQYIVQAAGNDATVNTWLNSFDFINLMIYSTDMMTYTKQLDWWTGTKQIPKKKLTWGVEFTSGLSVDVVKSLTTSSEGYGGIMAWEYSQRTAPTLWTAIQDTLP